MGRLQALVASMVLALVAMAAIGIAAWALQRSAESLFPYPDAQWDPYLDSVASSG